MPVIEFSQAILNQFFALHRISFRQTGKLTPWFVLRRLAMAMGSGKSELVRKFVFGSKIESRPPHSDSFFRGGLGLPMVNDSALVETPLQAKTPRLNLKPDSHWYYNL
jgi:hypothetical protein